MFVTPVSETQLLRALSEQDMTVGRQCKIVGVLATSSDLSV